MINLLKHTDFRADGLFGEFTFEGDEHPFMVTLEHAYKDHGDAEHEYGPKLKPGTYTCVRGIHHLHSGPVETFEVLGVVGHSGILCCHVGNRNADSEGCVLSGAEIIKDSQWWIRSSWAMYKSFMARLTGVDSFELVVT